MLPWDSSYGANPRLTRCFCRFVSRPRFEVPPPDPNQRVTYHLRTSFADADDAKLENVTNSVEATSAWADAACDRSSMEHGTHIMSDAPGLVGLLNSHPTPFSALTEGCSLADARGIARYR